MLLEKISKSGFVFFMCLILLSDTAFGQEDGNKNAIYDVKATIIELNNRTLECSVRNHKVIVDQPKSFGADDLGPTPPEMLAISCGSCVASTIQFIAYQRQIEVSDIKVIVEGQVAFAKAMGISDASRAGYQILDVKISFQSTLSADEKREFINTVMELGAAIDNTANETEINWTLVD